MRMPLCMDDTIEPTVICRAHAANYRLSAADLHAIRWSDRAISDGVFAALVCDIMVHPDLQASECQLVHRLHQTWEHQRLPMHLWRNDGFGRHVCDFQPVELQRQGLGKKLMAALLKHVRRRGPSSFGVFPRPKQVYSITWHNRFHCDTKPQRQRMAPHQVTTSVTAGVELQALSWHCLRPSPAPMQRFCLTCAAHVLLGDGVPGDEQVPCHAVPAAGA